MANISAITTANDRITLDPNRHGEVVFTVTSLVSRPLRGLAKLKSLGDTKQQWLTLAGEGERDFAVGATHQFMVRLDVPANIPPGKYPFRLDLVSSRNPDEDFTEGPTVTAEALPAKPKPPSKAWIVPLALIALLVIAGAIVLIIRKLEHKAEAPRGKSVVHIMTLGHESAGKTTLTSAITKVLSKTGGVRFIPYDQIKNPPEDRVQGVTIAAAQVEYETAKAHYVHWDCHGAADFEKLLNSDGVILDGAILVVSAEDGPMPQTREHLDLARKKGLKSIVVYLNKIDKVADAELLQLVELEIKELAAAYGFKDEGITLIRGSALMALNETNDEIGKESIIRLLGALDNHYVK